MYCKACLAYKRQEHSGAIVSMDSFVNNPVPSNCNNLVSKNVKIVNNVNSNNVYSTVNRNLDPGTKKKTKKGEETPRDGHNGSKGTKVQEENIIIN